MGKNIKIFESDSDLLVYLPAFGDEGKEVHDFLKEYDCPDHTLIVINELDWDNELSPWKAEPVFKGEPPFGGGGDRFLLELTQKIMPEVESGLKVKPKKRYISGYSLAGLFAIYSLYKTDIFFGASSASGSLWFPGFQEFAMENEMKRRPESIYFSLGDRESRSRNPLMRKVGEKTEALEKYYESLGIRTTFEMNPGNHFMDSGKRTAKGISWILNSEK